MAELSLTLAQYGLGGAVAGAVLLLHWMSLRGFAREMAAEREVSQGVWSQFLTLKLQHHTQLMETLSSHNEAVMRVLSEHSVILAELRLMASREAGRGQ